MAFPALLGLGSEDAAAETKVPLGNIMLPANVDEDIFREFLGNQPYVLENLETTIMRAESDPHDENISTVKGILHSIKREAGLMGLTEMSGTCPDAESLIEASADDFPAEKLLATKDWLQNAVAQFAGENPQGGAEECSSDWDLHEPQGAQPDVLYGANA